MKDETNKISDLITKMRIAQGKAQDIYPKYEKRKQEALELKNELVDQIAEETLQTIMERYGIDIPKKITENEDSSFYTLHVRDSDAWVQIHDLSEMIVKYLELGVIK